MQYEEIAALLPDYLDDKLSHRQQQQVNTALKESEQLRQALASLQDLQLARNQWQDEEVPQWHRTAFAARVQRKPVNWMNWISFATSMAAICLVVFRIQIVSNDAGYQLSFGEQVDKARFREQADTYLNDWQAEQIAFLEHRLLEFENQQLQESQQVLTSALEFNRSERHQDLNQLTSYFLKQRSVDMAQTQTQYKLLYDSQTEDRKAIDTLYASIEK